MPDFLKYLDCLFAWIKGAIIAGIVEVFEKIAAALLFGISLLLDVIPSWPEESIRVPADVAGMLNYLIPMDWFFGYVSGFLAAWVVYRVVRALLDRTKGVVNPPAQS